MAQGTTKGVPIDVDPLLDLDSDLVVPSQKAIKAYVDAKKSAADNDYVNVSGDNMTGFLTLNADPTINLHAATKQYVDNYINGLDYKKAANAGTVAPLPACTATTQTLTGNVNGAITSSITDGYTLLTDNRVLVKNQVATANNGIYVVTRTGDASTTFLLTRADDANTGAELGEATLSIIYGSTLANTIWHCTPASVPIVLGTTGLTFIQVGSGSVGTGNIGELTYWSSPTSLGSLATVPVGNGGTAITSYTVGDMLYADTGNVLLKLSMPMNQNSVLVAGTTPSWSNTPSLDSLTLRSTGSLTLGLSGPSGNTGQILLKNSANTNTLTLESGASSSSYKLTLPVTAPGVNQYMQFTSAGVGTWVNGTVNGVTTPAAIGSVPNANGMTISGSTLNLQPADATFGGVLTAIAQNIAGAKTFTSAITSASVTSTDNTLGTALNIRNLYNNAVTRTYSNITSGADTTVTHTSSTVLAAGTLVRLATITGITGITANTDYYVYSSTATTLKLATTYANALAGTPIVTTGTYSGSSATLTVHASAGTGTTLTFTSGGGATPTSFIGSAIDSVLTAYGTNTAQPTYDLVFRTMAAGAAAAERFRATSTGLSVNGSITGSTGTLLISGTGSSSLPQLTISGSNSYSWMRFNSGGSDWPKTLTGLNAGRSTGEKINFGDASNLYPASIGMGLGTFPANSQTFWSTNQFGVNPMTFAAEGGFHFFNYDHAENIGWGAGINTPIMSIHRGGFGSVTALILRSKRQYGTALNKTISEINRNTTNTLFVRTNNVTSLYANQVARINITPTSNLYNGIVGRMLTVSGTATYGNLVFAYTSLVGNGTDITLTGVYYSYLPTFITGTAVSFSNIGTTGLTAGTTYYVYGYSSAGTGSCKIALSYANAIAGTPISGLTGTASGNCSVAAIAANSTEGIAVYGVSGVLNTSTSFITPGTPVALSNITGIGGTGLTAGTIYYLYNPSSISSIIPASFRLASSFANAIAGTPITTATDNTAVGTGFLGTATSNSVTIYSTVSDTYTSGGTLDAVMASGSGGNAIGIYFDKDDDLGVVTTTGQNKNIPVLNFIRTGPPGEGTFGLFADTNISQKVTIANYSTNINIAENITSQAFTLNILAGAGFDTLTANSTRAINIGTGYANSNTFFSTTNINIGFSGSVSSRAAVVTNIKFDGNIGFYNTTPQSKPTVTGAKGGNAALTSLCTALATLGLITNSTT